MNEWEKDLCKCPNCGGNHFLGNSYGVGQIEHERLCWDCGYMRYYEKIECLCPKEYYLNKTTKEIYDYQSIIEYQQNQGRKIKVGYYDKETKKAVFT